ncbi:phospho-2-dehydro-3-deoxyheptonate aldolase [gamma proteobacterium HTCC5015]|nr:phospho-2-dehydro-3-deoxyheptonate aldolase [gamma proteobacterium HTCC5015]
MTTNTDNLRIVKTTEVSKPSEVLQELPINDTAADVVAGAREGIHNILNDNDDRMMVLVGPCSIHDPKAAMDYANKLKALSDELKDDLLIVMRVYFEKPRTTVGWKGLINDPNLDGSFEINKGLRMARGLLLDINKLGLPAGTEYLDLITPQYVSDLIAWGAIGARTTESQCHRELSSGLSCPVGFKNGTDGGLQVAVDAIGAASRPHHFISVTKEGHSAIFTTKGNEDCHVILRGGKQPNYDAASVDDASEMLEKAGLRQKLMIDTSHANSRKIHERQIDVSQDIANQVRKGDKRIFGVMVESHLVAGNQKVVDGVAETYGQSITDACIGWPETEDLLRNLADAVRERRQA